MFERGSYKDYVNSFAGNYRQTLKHIGGPRPKRKDKTVAIHTL